jgi:flavin-dependent dehydrogenase
MGATVYRQHTVKHAHIDADKVVVQVHEPNGGHEHVAQASLLVDASGRAAFLGHSLGKRGHFLI